MGYTAQTPPAANTTLASSYVDTMVTNDQSFHNGTGIAALEVGGVAAVKNDYKFSVYRNGAQTIGNGTKIAWDTEEYDTGSNFDSVTNNNYTAPIPEFKHFDAQVSYPTTSGMTRCGISLFKNGAEVKRGTDNANTAGTAGSASVSADIQLAANDTVDVRTIVAGTNFAIQTGSVTNHFSGHYISTT